MLSSAWSRGHTAIHTSYLTYRNREFEIVAQHDRESAGAAQSTVRIVPAETGSLEIDKDGRTQPTPIHTMFVSYRNRKFESPQNCRIQIPQRYIRRINPVQLVSSAMMDAEVQTNKICMWKTLPRLIIYEVICSRSWSSFSILIPESRQLFAVGSSRRRRYRRRPGRQYPPRI
jgi:hypothetical protein